MSEYERLPHQNSSDHTKAVFEDTKHYKFSFTLDLAFLLRRAFNTMAKTVCIIGKYRHLENLLQKAC